MSYVANVERTNIVCERCGSSLGRAPDGRLRHIRWRLGGQKSPEMLKPGEANGHWTPLLQTGRKFNHTPMPVDAKEYKRLKAEREAALDLDYEVAMSRPSTARTITASIEAWRKTESFSP